MGFSSSSSRLQGHRDMPTGSLRSGAFVNVELNKQRVERPALPGASVFETHVASQAPGSCPWLCKSEARNGYPAQKIVEDYVHRRIDPDRRERCLNNVGDQPDAAGVR